MKKSELTSNCLELSRVSNESINNVVADEIMNRKFY